MTASWTKWLLQSLQVVFLFEIQHHSTEVKANVLSTRPGDFDAVVGRWNANITCMINDFEQAKFNASDLIFTYQIGSSETIDVPLTYVTTINGSTIQLRHFPEIDAYPGKNIVKYVNCNKRGDEDSRVTIEVNVSKRHQNPQIKDIIVKNWETLSFAWETKHDPIMYHKMAYEAWYWNSSEYASPMKCKNSENEVCKVSRPFQVALPGDVLIVKVNGSAETKKSQGILETVSSDEVRVNLTQYLIPNKVELINVTQNQSNKTLVFQPPKTNRNITYSINVKCNRHPFITTMTVTRLVTDSDNDTLDGKNSQRMSVTEHLVGLPPYSNCTVSVRAISVNGGNWSEWTHHKFETLQDVPLAAPRSCSSCFQVKESGMNALFDVIVYFTPLSEEEARGRVERYRIRKIVDDVLENTMELSPDPRYSFSFLLSNLLSESDYKISIEAKTMIGYNKTLNLSSVIRIPESRNRTQPVSYKFIVVILNDTAFRTTWEVEERSVIEKIFLFWCKGNPVKNDRPCKNHLKWKEFPIAFTSNAINITYITNLDTGESSYDFIFGIGIEHNGKSSGITWNNCTYDIRALPPEPRIVSHPPTSSGISIFLLEPPCRNIGPERGFVIGYRVFLCPVSTSGSTEDRPCLEEMRSFDFIGRYEVLNLTDLRTNQTYDVLIQSVSETRTSKNMTFKVTTLAAETSGVTVVVVAVVVVFVVVFVVFMVAVMALPVKGKPIWRYFKDFCTVGIIVIPPAAKVTIVDSGYRTAEDEGYRSNSSGRTENEEMVVAAPLLSGNSVNYSEVSAADNNSTGTASPPKRSFEFLESINSSNDMPVSVDAPVTFNGPATVDIPVAFKGPLTADIPVPFNGPVTVDVPVPFKDPLTAAVPVEFNGPVTYNGPVNVSVAFNGPVAVDVSVASEASTALEVPVNVNVAVSVSPSVCADTGSLGPVKSHTSVEYSSERILPSLFSHSAKTSVDFSNPAIKSGNVEDEARRHQLQQQQPQEPASDEILYTPASICDSLVLDQYYIGGATGQSMHGQFFCEKPLNHEEGYVFGSQRVCSIFLPVPHEPAHPVMLDSSSEFSNDGLAAEDAVPSLQTDLYHLSDARNEDTSTGMGYHCSAEFPSPSTHFTCDDTRDDSDYPPMRIIEVDFYDGSGRFEKELLADDVTISNDVTISTDPKMSDEVAVSTGDIISTDVIASHDFVTISNDAVLKKPVHCSPKGILSLCEDYNPSEAIDEPCVYSTVVDVDVSSQKLSPVDPILPEPGGGADDGYYSGVRVLGSLSSDPRSQDSEASEDGCWPLLDEIHDQRHADCSVSPVFLSRSSSTLPWLLHQQPTDSDPCPARVLPSILPPCV